MTTPSWGTQEVPAGLAPTTSLPRGLLLLAAAALVVVLVVRHAGCRRRSFARMLTLLRVSMRRHRRLATRQAVDQVLRSVRQIAYALPFRIACLEETIAAMLILTTTGRSAVWCQGVATDPIRLHAWLTVDGVPVAEPTSTARYTALFHVPETGRIRGRKEIG
ncbi:MAG: lasso peptide biosynthesis B2 protein [Pseudonocardiaceae bacterium]